MTIILAVDPGSIGAAIALFKNSKLKAVAVLEAKTYKQDWQRRVSSIAADLQVLEWEQPDLIAIEQVVAHMNVRAALTMAQTVGYLRRTLEVMYPTALWMEVPKASICHALGIKGNVKRKDRQDAAKARFKLHSQDACDAAAVGIGAMLMMEAK